VNPGKSKNAGFNRLGAGTCNELAAAVPRSHLESTILRIAGAKAVEE
jgi:hypothetical protein